jgi:Polyketide cyclase / dehydrase and lipid transport
MRTRRNFVALLLLFSFSFARAADEESFRSFDPNEGWKFVTKSDDLIIYSRIRAGSPLKEFKGIGEIDAGSLVVRAVIDDFENYPSFMPYTVECRVVKREGDSIIGYQRLAPKICSDRDYTLRVSKKSWPVDGGTAYLSRWTAANELGPPERKGIVRVKTCEGGWLLEPAGENKTRATYSVYTDTGGAIPAFLANHASQMGIGKLFAAVRKQSKDPKYQKNDE